jgi:hypothetical protein
MLANEITIGMQAAVKIGQRLAVVTITGKANYSGGRRQAWWCRTADTNRMITATAARLRPMPGTPEAAAEKARKAKADARRIAKTPSGTYRSTPAPEAPVLVSPAPVPGMITRVNPSQPVERLVGRNREMVEHIVAGVDVALPWSAACRAVYRVIGKGGRLRGFPRHLRRGAWLKVAEEHAANRRLYRETMGHDPIPSVETITAAMTGDAAARAAVLAG